jgi:hypothetical protein
MIYQPVLSGSYQQTPSSQTEETWREMTVNFAYEVSLFILVGICHKILRHGTDDFTSPPKEVVLRVLLPLKNILLGRV